MVEQRPQALSPLRQLLAGGDVLSPNHVRLFFKSAPQTTLINGYGPTENTTFTCCHLMRGSDPLSEPIPIGRPISNTYVYILDEDGNPVSPGASGELYAAGDGVARGYLHDPEATAAKFLLNPFSHEPQRMYRTGDLARWRPDGTIDFMGRADSQVKILGHRIEPGEIESVLQAHAGVKQACVVAHTELNGGKRLVAYVVPAGNPAPVADDLRGFLQSRLPQHMVPAFFVPLEAFPLSPHGKIDRAALAAKELAGPAQSQANTSANTQVESMLSQVWQRVLNVPRVGLDDNFFDLGGDSLLLVSVHSNLQKTLQRTIQVTDLFEFTTIRKLARHLDPDNSAEPAFSDSQQRAQRQREAFAKLRRRSGGES
jgi:non-ribosomal peptide synthetase component F